MLDENGNHQRWKAQKHKLEQQKEELSNKLNSHQLNPTEFKQAQLLISAIEHATKILQMKLDADLAKASEDNDSA